MTANAARPRQPRPTKVLVTHSRLADFGCQFDYKWARQIGETELKMLVNLAPHEVILVQA
jgi:hypothetical protein